VGDAVVRARPAGPALGAVDGAAPTVPGLGAWSRLLVLHRGDDV